MTREEIELEARLQAIEYLLAHFINALYAAAHANETMIELAEADLAKKLEAATIPKIDAAMSDHVAAELLNAVQRLLAEAKQMRALAGKPKDS